MFEMSFSVKGHMASTLDADEVCEGPNGVKAGSSSRTHPDGWTIFGEVIHDWYYWVNDFEATHPTFGRVWGNFEDKVFAESEAAYDAFCANHGPESWDYWDI